MAWSSSNRQHTLPADWPARIDATRRRAGGRCEQTTNGQRCTAPGTDCDHKVSHADGGTDDLDNLQWLCHPHHKAKTARENARRNTLRARARRRPPEPHPGRRQ